MPAHFALHLFIDESGRFDNPASADHIPLVGGVLVFGNYGRQADDEFRDLLHGATLAMQERDFPDVLHRRKPPLSPEKVAKFAAHLGARLPSWEGDRRRVFGAAIARGPDVFATNPRLLVESEFDNRYVAMLWALLEHLVFVDPQVAALLEGNAALHLHIAKRVYRFPREEAKKQRLRAQGLEVEDDQEDPEHYYRVPSILKERDLLGMFRSALRERWVRSRIDLEEIDIRPIGYKGTGKGGQSWAAHFLADFYLFYQAEAEARARSRAAPASGKVPPILPTLRLPEYGPELEWEARVKADLLALESPAHALGLLEDACRDVDWPGKIREGFVKGSRAVEFLRQAGLAGLQAEVLWLQVRLSHANHTGDLAKAREVWGEYENKEPELLKLGARGLQLAAAMRNRRAVHLTDRFQYEQARSILEEVASAREGLLDLLAGRFSIRKEEMPDHELGACHGSLGQVHAFLGNTDQAETCFLRARELFTDPEHRERPWVYLGHLACDHPGDRGRALWQRVLRQLPDLGRPEPISGPGAQYRLALQMKGVLVFGGDEELARFLSHGHGQAAPLLQPFSEEARAQHPFGLIHQALAMLCEKAWDHKLPHPEGAPDKWLECARAAFDEAKRHLEAPGTPVLQFLADVAGLRRWLLSHRSSPRARDKAKDRLKELLTGLEDHLRLHFGEPGAREGEPAALPRYFADLGLPADDPSLTQRAEKWVRAVHFNFW